MKGTKELFLSSLWCVPVLGKVPADSTNSFLKMTPIDQYLAGMLKKTKVVRALNYLCRSGLAAVKEL